MGRKSKCTVEEKISAVEDYLNGIKSVRDIMNELSVKSTRTKRRSSFFCVFNVKLLRNFVV